MSTRQFCDECGKRTQDSHIDSYNTNKGDYKIEFKFQVSGSVHLWSPTDLCIDCKLKVLKEFAKKITKNQLEVEGKYNSLT